MNIASYIDHTLLAPAATHQQIEQLCNEAVEYKFASVCLPPVYVARAKNILKDTIIPVCTVIGFPLGYNSIKTKLYETEEALLNGAKEIDVVISLAALHNNNWEYLEEEINLITNICLDAGALTKVIIESGILSSEQIIACCNFYNQFPIQYLKTSTGFAAKGATEEAVILFKTHLSSAIKIKASGGIRNFADATKYVNLGASRLGCSASINIVNNT
jgi:deoxyribose-phosphate aldolase